VSASGIRLTLGTANIMPDADLTPLRPTEGDSALMWDMAGTLIPFDPVTGRASALPGCSDFLPELGNVFRLVVTTGDSTASARGLLTDFELLSHFEAVYGDLFLPVGKPYGEILRQLGARPDCSLAIGDRLRADIPADTAELVTILVNQNGDVINAGMVSFIIRILRQHGPSFPAAFDHLTTDADPDADAVGESRGGTIGKAWRRNDGFPYRLWSFTHPALDGSRRVIVI